MIEEKPLLDFSDAELSDDPLIFLACGHIFPVSSLDGTVELTKTYGQAHDGSWEKPLPMEVSGSHRSVTMCPVISQSWRTVSQLSISICLEDSLVGSLCNAICTFCL